MEHLRHHLSSSYRDGEDPPLRSGGAGLYDPSPTGPPQPWHHGQGTAFQGSPTTFSSAIYSGPQNLPTISPTAYSNARPGIFESAPRGNLPLHPGPVNPYPYGPSPIPRPYDTQGPDLSRLSIGSSPNPGQFHHTRRSQASTYISFGSNNSYGSMGTSLDPSYVMKNERYFEPGKVFSCLYTETAGETSGARSKNHPRFAPVCLGQYAYSNISRFVVMQTRPDQKFSICCPIKTYGHRGVNKFPGHHQHSIIYTGDVEPKPLDGEVFAYRGIQMIPQDFTTPLDNLSRLNFGKPTPVEHNVRVKHLGKINERHRYRLFRYYAHANNTEKLAAEAKNRPASRVRSSTSNREQYGVYNEDDDEEAVEEEEEEEEEEGEEGEEYGDDFDSRPTSGRRTSVNDRRLSMSGRAPSSGDRSGYPRDMPTRTERSDTMRSSPVPFGSQRLVATSSRRLTSEQLEPRAPDPRSRRDSDDYRRRGDKNRREY